MRREKLTYSSPVRFTRRQRLQLNLYSRAIAGALSALGITCRTATSHQDRFDSIVTEHGRGLLAFWHEALGIALYHYRKSGYHTLTSYSFDGELAARVAQRLGMHALRGSSSRGGRQGLEQLVKAAQCRQTIGFTLDGPRGPRRVAKAGIAVLSIRTGIPVSPVMLAADRTWRLRSWDRLMIPKPFTTVRCNYGDPIHPPSEQNADTIEHMRLRIETALNGLHERFEASQEESQP